MEFEVLSSLYIEKLVLLNGEILSIVVLKKFTSTSERCTCASKGINL